MATSSLSFSRLARSLFRHSESWIVPASSLRTLSTIPSSRVQSLDGTYTRESSPESESDCQEGTLDVLTPPDPVERAGVPNPTPFPYRLNNGMDIGIYKAILVGQAGQAPVQKKLKSGRIVTLFSVGTGGIRNNRRPFDDEDPMQYAGRCSVHVQWHRACIYSEPLGRVAMEHMKPGSVVYIEGNLETKIFNDPMSGLPRQIREIAIRRDGRVVFLGKGDDIGEPPAENVRKVGYF